MKMKRMIRVDILAIVLLACSLVLMSAQQQGSSKEYEYVHLNMYIKRGKMMYATFNQNLKSAGERGFNNIDEIMNHMGEQGWEFKALVDSPGDMNTIDYLFMREKP